MKNFLFAILFALTSLFSFGQTNVTLSFTDSETETNVNFATSNPTLMVIFEDFPYDFVFLNGENLSQNGSVFPATGGYFNVTFQNGDVDILIFVAGGGVYVDTLYLTNTLNTIENDKLYFTVYPNPTVDFLNVRVDNYDGDFEVFDLSGKLLIKTSDKSIDVSFLNSGQYILRVGTTTKLFIKN